MSRVIPTAHVGLGGLGKRIPVVTSVSFGMMAATVGAAADNGTVLLEGFCWAPVCTTHAITYEITLSDCSSA